MLHDEEMRAKRTYYDAINVYAIYIYTDGGRKVLLADAIVWEIKYAVLSHFSDTATFNTQVAVSPVNSIHRHTYHTYLIIHRRSLFFLINFILIYLNLN